MKNFNVIAKAFNYAFLFKPVTYSLVCNRAVPLGITTVSAFNELEEVERKVLFLIKYGQDIIGTDQFKSVQAYWDYVNVQCACCAEPILDCGILLNGCNLTLNGCNFI